MSLEITEDNFDNHSNGDKPLIVDFWAPWCGPCRMVGPIVEELATEMEDRVTIGKLNVDENNELSQKFNVSSIPTILFIKNGKEAGRHVGAGSKDTLSRKFEEWLSA